MLARHHIEVIENCIEQSAITIPTLRDDLLDHLCCVVEKKLGEGKSFEESLREALHGLAPGGLEEIQRETVFLLNLNKAIAMKGIMYFVGMLSVMSFVLGWTFGMMHWAGATELSVYGFLGFVMVFIPLYAIDYFKMKVQRELLEKLTLTLGILSAITWATAVVFKLLHLRGADVLLISGAGIFCFLFLPVLFFSLYKKSLKIAEQ